MTTPPADLHLRDPGGVVPHVATETYCGAEDSVGDVDEVDPGGAVHAQPRRHPAQILQHREPIASREPAARVRAERADRR